MLGFHVFVDYILENLDYVVQIMMHSLDFFAIGVVGLTVRTKREESSDDLALHNYLSLVEFSFFPDSFRDRFY